MGNRVKAIDIIREADGPKKFLKANPQHGIAHAQRPIDRNKDFAFHFIFGSPIAMSFDVIASNMAEAVPIANSHADSLLRNGYTLDDQRDTIFSWDENVKFRITESHCLMWWQLNADEDPTLNPNFGQT